MTGGSLSESIVVDFAENFNHIIAIGDGYAITEPGVYYRDFEKETAKRGWSLPSYPASRDLCTVGGMVANNSGGEKTLRYGKTEQYIDEINMVLADGNEYTFHALTEKQLARKKSQDNFEGHVYREMSALIQKNSMQLAQAKPTVKKNSAGYYLWNVFDQEKRLFDLTKMIVGSQGTLGLMTALRFSLVRPRTHSCMVVLFLEGTEQIGEIIRTLLAADPECLESYDHHTISLAMKFFPTIVKKMHGSLFQLAREFLPEFKMMLLGGMPRLIIMAEFTADTFDTARENARRAQQTLRAFHVRTHIALTEREQKKYWTFRRESFNLLRQHMKKLQATPFIDDFVVAPEHLSEFFPRLEEIMSEYKLIYTIAGHAGSGNFHIIPLMDLSHPATRRIILELSQKVYALVLSYGGSITGEHNDGLIRTPYLEMMYGAKICALFQRTKEIFDPLGIFNPGKKVGGNLIYALDHLRRN